jgi:ammonia channel protein AmtB
VHSGRILLQCSSARVLLRTAQVASAKSRKNIGPMVSRLQGALGIGFVAWVLVGLVIALHPQTPKHLRDLWSYYTDTSERVDCNGTQNMVTVQSWFEPTTFRSLAYELTDCSNRTHWVYIVWDRKCDKLGETMHKKITLK